MENGANSIRKSIEDRLIDAYDKSVVDLETVAAVINVALMQEYMWRTYYNVIDRAADTGPARVYMRLGEDEQRHQDVTTCMNDRSETVLEKAVAMQAAYLRRLAEFAVNEPDDDIRLSYEYILADHLTHHRQFSLKLARLEGLSPLARAGFRGRDGRAIDRQFIEIEAAPKTSYRKEFAAPLTKVQARLALAAELAQREACRVMACLSKDKHLIVIFQQAAIVDNRHIAILRSLIDPKETPLESAYLSEMAEVVDLERAVGSTPSGRINSAFGDLLDEDKLHLRVLEDLLAKDGGRVGDRLTEPRPELKAVAGLDAVIEAIVENSSSLVPKAGRWLKA